MKKVSTGKIYRAFKNEDENTVIRKLNLRIYWNCIVKNTMTKTDPRRNRKHE